MPTSRKSTGDGNITETPATTHCNYTATNPSQQFALDPAADK